MSLGLILTRLGLPLATVRVAQGAKLGEILLWAVRHDLLSPLTGNRVRRAGELGGKLVARALGCSAPLWVAGRVRCEGRGCTRCPVGRARATAATPD